MVEGMEVLVGRNAGQSLEGDAGVFLQCEVRTLVTPPSLCTALVRVERVLVDLPGKGLARDATKRLWFVVHAAGWLHSMVLHERIGSCCIVSHSGGRRSSSNSDGDGNVSSCCGDGSCCIGIGCRGGISSSGIWSSSICGAGRGSKIGGDQLEITSIEVTIKRICCRK